MRPTELSEEHQDLLRSIASFLGWENLNYHDAGFTGTHPNQDWNTPPITWVPNYLWDFTSAWELVKRFQERGAIIRIGPYLPGRYCATLCWAPCYEGGEKFIEESEALAVCRAVAAAIADLKNQGFETLNG